MTYTEIIRLYEKKDHIIKKTHMTDEQKQEVIEFFTKHREQENQISGDEWNKPELLTYERFKQVMDAFNNRNTKSRANKIANKIGIAGLTEGVDYKDLGEHTCDFLGTFHAYVPLSWLGAKTIEGPTVKPVNSDKDSAGWCIGWSSENTYWNNYFFTGKKSFLILCGEKVPTKKVCVEIFPDYAFSIEDIYLKCSIWNYYDDKQDTEFITGTYKTVEILLEKLISSAKKISDPVREKLIKEYTTPRVIEKSDYLKKLDVYRKNSNYKKFIKLGEQFLLDIDLLTEQVRKQGTEIKIATLSGDLKTSKEYPTFSDWIKEEKIRFVKDAYIIPFIHPIFYTMFYYSNPESNARFDNSVSDFHSCKIKRHLKNTESINNYFLSIGTSEETPLGDKKVIAEFNPYDYLTVQDLIAFLGEEISTCTASEQKKTDDKDTYSGLYEIEFIKEAKGKKYNKGVIVYCTTTEAMLKHQATLRGHRGNNTSKEEVMSIYKSYLSEKEVSSLIDDLSSGYNIKGNLSSTGIIDFTTTETLIVTIPLTKDNLFDKESLIAHSYTLSAINTIGNLTEL